MKHVVSAFLKHIAHQYGPRPALLYKNGYRTQTWTYQALLDQTLATACWLEQQGVPMKSPSAPGRYHILANRKARTVTPAAPQAPCAPRALHPARPTPTFRRETTQ